VLLTLFIPLSAWADALTEGRAGRAEIRFLQGMIDHHMMALVMAQDCLVKAGEESVRIICQNVIASQTPEIEQMAAWLADWYAIDYSMGADTEGMVAMMTQFMTPDGMMAVMPMQEHGDHGGHSMGGDEMAYDPRMMMGMMAGFNRLEGLDYDIAWLESMIDHHDDALHMAERILAQAHHADLITLAEAIISAQTAEIAQMEALIADLSA
jgi:uncharacterized protein (DUF305 family)